MIAITGKTSMQMDYSSMQNTVQGLSHAKKLK